MEKKKEKRKGEENGKKWEKIRKERDNKVGEEF